MNIKFLFIYAFCLSISSLSAPLSPVIRDQLDRVVASKLRAVDQRAALADKIALLNRFISEFEDAKTRYETGSQSSHSRRESPQFSEKADYVIERLHSHLAQFQEVKKGEAVQKIQRIYRKYSEQRPRKAEAARRREALKAKAEEIRRHKETQQFNRRYSEHRAHKAKLEEERDAEIERRRSLASAKIILSLAELKAWVIYNEGQAQTIKQQISSMSNLRDRAALERKYKKLITELEKNKRELEIWESHKRGSRGYYN